MKHPTIEEIKGRYKNAKKVRCVSDGKVYCNIDDIDKFNIGTLVVDYLCYGYCINTNKEESVYLYRSAGNEYAEIVEYKEEVPQLENTGLDMISKIKYLCDIKYILNKVKKMNIYDEYHNKLNYGNLSYNERVELNKKRIEGNKKIIEYLENKINVEVTTKEQRDELIKQLQEMEFEKKLPESWEELEIVDGFCIDEYSSIYHSNRRAVDNHKNTFSSREQAQSALAYAQLTQLLKAYNEDWKPDWSDCNQNKFIIYNFDNRISLGDAYYTHCFIALETKDKAEHFLKHHKELIKQFYMID